jgi:hypothetical protein
LDICKGILEKGEWKREKGKMKNGRGYERERMEKV